MGSNGGRGGAWVGPAAGVGSPGSSMPTGRRRPGARVDPDGAAADGSGARAGRSDRGRLDREDRRRRCGRMPGDSAADQDRSEAEVGRGGGADPERTRRTARSGGGGSRSNGNAIGGRDGSSDPWRADVPGSTSPVIQGIGPTTCDGLPSGSGAGRPKGGANVSCQWNATPPRAGRSAASPRPPRARRGHGRGRRHRRGARAARGGRGRVRSARASRTRRPGSWSPGATAASLPAGVGSWANRADSGAHSDSHNPSSLRALGRAVNRLGNASANGSGE